MRGSKLRIGGRGQPATEEGASDNDQVWGPYPSARSEAKFLLSSARCTVDTIESLRQSIVADEEEAGLLGLLAADDPEYNVEIPRLLDFRRRVLVEFDRLISGIGANKGNSPSADPQPENKKSQRCCPGCGKVFKAMTDKQWRSLYQIHLTVSLRHKPSVINAI